MERNLFQILITESDCEPALPQLFVDNVTSLRAHHPDYAYHRLDNAALESFLSAHFDDDTLQAYRTLRPYAYKADIGRYALLLVHGGIYADMVMRILRPIVLSPGKQMLCCRDSAGTGLWTVSTSLMAACKGQEVLKLAIDLIVANVRSGYYGATMLHPTGPALLGRALAITDRAQEVDLGTFDCLTPNGNPHNLGHTDGFGRIVSMRMKSGSFAELGIPGTNNYPTIWNARMIYGESFQISHEDSRLVIKPTAGGVRRDPDGIAFEPCATGMIVSGHHVSLPAGRYIAYYTLAPESRRDGLVMDVAIEGMPIAARRAREGKGECIEVPFHLHHFARRLDVRIISNGGTKGKILGLTISPA